MKFTPRDKFPQVKNDWRRETITMPSICYWSALVDKMGFFCRRQQS